MLMYLNIRRKFSHTIAVIEKKKSIISNIKIFPGNLYSTLLHICIRKLF